MKNTALMLCLLMMISLCACSAADDSVSGSDISGADSSASDISASDAVVFDEEQLRVADMLSENARMLTIGETQMYMMAIAAHSEQYEATQQYVLDLCANNDVAIELEFISIDISGDTAQATVDQLMTLTPKDGSAPVMYRSVLRHDMICRSGIWNILYTYCESTLTLYDTDTLIKPIADGIDALCRADVDAYMSTVNPDSRSYEDTELKMRLMRIHYEMLITLDSFELIEQTNSAAVIRTVQTTTLNSLDTGETSVYTCVVLHDLVLTDGVWYVDSSECESSELLSGPAIETN